MTKVIFREIKEDQNIIAIFPELKENGDLFLCYQHIGQHGAACKEFYLDDTIPTKDFKELYNELKSVGYDDLKIMQRF